MMRPGLTACLLGLALLALPAAAAAASRDELFTLDDEDTPPAPPPPARQDKAKSPAPSTAPKAPAAPVAPKRPAQADAPKAPAAAQAPKTKTGPSSPAAPPERVAQAKPRSTAAREGALRWSGFVQEEAARQYSAPAHWTKVRTRAQLNAQGALESGIKWKLGARLDYDPVFDLTDHYPGAVRQNRQLELLLRENYLDFNAGPLELRVGRQHIIWGEMVGLFFADVVSARDSREFILPEFEYQRLPQWALRAEHFQGDWHSEIIWIPHVTVDEFGNPADDFHPGLISLPGFDMQVRDRVKPGRRLRDSNAGLRVGVLKAGWDVSAFYYSSVDATPHFTRSVENLPAPTLVYTPRHGRINQAGGTLAKDFGRFVVKAETIYTRGRAFSVTDPADADGVVKQNLLDYVLGVEFGLREQDVRFNAQVFQRRFLDHVSTLIPDRTETGVSFLVNGTFGKLTPQLLVLQSLNDNDRLLRPSVDWAVARNTRARLGLDILTGPATGFFGQYANRDRAYLELKYSF